MTWRAVIIALLLLVLLAPAAFYGELVHMATYQFASGVPAMAPLVVVLLLTAANPLLGRLIGGRLTRRELLTIYCVVLVGAPLVSHGVLAWMLPHSLIQHYLARAQPEWQTGILPYLPTWFSPSETDAVEGYFVGRAVVPWSLWWTPLAAWGSFMLALFLSTLCLVLLFRVQWISHERLSFPIAQVPLEMVSETGDVRAGEGGRRWGRLPIGWMFWIGFLISFGIAFISRLSSIFPAIPAIPVGETVLIPWQKVGPLAGLGDIWLVLYPWMIAIAYLIPKELSFSCWFFWLLRVGMTVLAIAAGATPERPEEWWNSTFPAPYHQGGGAAIALGAWALWTGRKHFARAVRMAFTRRGRAAEEGAPLAYRWVFAGFLISFGYLNWFCWAAGCRPLVGLAIVGLIVAYYMMWSRMRAETGLGFVPFPLIVNSMMVVPFGSSVFRPTEIVTMINTRWSYFPGFGESFEVCTGNALDSFKIADSARLPSRPLLAAMAAGFVVMLVVGIYVVLTGTYHYGFLNMRASTEGGGWLHSQLRADGTSIFNMLANPSKSDVNGIIGIGAGMVVAITLGMMRLRFWWWPFHPIGYVAANCWGMQEYYMPFFIGWLCKSLVIRYGGLRLYRYTVPLAIGFMIGPSLNGGVWSIIELFVKGRL